MFPVKHHGKQGAEGTRVAKVGAFVLVPILSYSMKHAILLRLEWLLSI